MQKINNMYFLFITTGSIISPSSSYIIIYRFLFNLFPFFFYICIFIDNFGTFSERQPLDIVAYLAAKNT